MSKFIVSITGYNGSTCNACPDLKEDCLSNEWEYSCRLFKRNLTLYEDSCTVRRCTTCNKAEILCCEIVGSGKTVATMTHTIEPYNEFLCGGCKYLSEDNKIWNAFSCSLFEEDLVHINKDHIERCGLCIEAENNYNKENSNE